MYDAEADMMEAYRERQDAFAPLATMADAHREWHLNAGVPMGQPGCPQDACHPIDDFDPDDFRIVRCGYCKKRHDIATVRVHGTAR